MEENAEENLPKPEEKIVDFPLPLELIEKNIGLILKSLFGEGYMYTRVILSEKKLTDIDNILMFKNLFYVDISKNYLQNIRALRNMKFLLTLNASFNRIDDISELPENKLLSEINLSKNQIEKLPVLDMPNLKYLNLNYNKISTLKNENQQNLICANLLTTFEIRNNLLTSTNGITLPWLTNLYLAGNQITEIRDLVGHQVLMIVHLRDNKIEVLDGLDENIIKLKYLNLRNNKISNFQEIKKLANLLALEHLVLKDNPISENEDYRISVLRCIPTLKRLDKTEFEDEEKELLKVDDTKEDEE